MALVEKTNHVEEALDNFVQQFKNKAKFDAFMTAFVTQIQDLETVYFEILLARYLDNAEGVQLDGIGSIVGESREGRTDADYKIAIRGRILLNLSQGTPEELMQLLKAVTDGHDIEISEYFPAALIARIVGIWPDLYYASGTHTAATSLTVLTDNTKNWAIGELMGMVAWNDTDKCVGLITSNTATTATCAAGLFSGTDNDWDLGDVYGVIEQPVRIANILRSGKLAGVKAHLSFFPDNPFTYDMVPIIGSGLGYDEGRWGGII